MKKRLSIIITGFCISFGLMVALSLFSMERFTMLTRYSDQVNHSGVVIIGIRSAEVRLRDITNSERGYIITKDTAYQRRLDAAIDSLGNIVEQLKALTIDNPEQQKNITLLRGSIALKIAAARDNINYVDTTTAYDRSKYFDDSRNFTRECSQRLAAMRTAENKLLAERTQEQRFYQKLTNDALTYLLVVFCAITLVLFIIMVRELRSRMLFQEELQAKVIDLKRSHNELKEISYAASHDLQEPLRKIQVFSNMLLYQKSGNEEERRDTLKRINYSANRMQELITDLMSLANLTSIDEPRKSVDLNIIMSSVVLDLQDKITGKDASLETHKLPVVRGYDKQLFILFTAILDNALKFTREGVRPVITVTCEITGGHELSGVNPSTVSAKFYKITFSDNGIGFENQFINKMFGIFQRLHSQESEYAGKGIGLAICQRIMANHEGYIVAQGEPHMGAHFKLFFPVAGS